MPSNAAYNGKRSASRSWMSLLAHADDDDADADADHDYYDDEGK